mmetsp:Transcript_79347/g.145196  ORF Transcript_79347/g.145196 Transcript_79347/m.145196 type:complete len:83 (-) Transcript_79347:46-294(-)
MNASRSLEAPAVMAATAEASYVEVVHEGPAAAAFAIAASGIPREPSHWIFCQRGLAFREMFREAKREVPGVSSVCRACTAGQ